VRLDVELVEPEITRLRLRSWQGRLAGYEVSAYVVRGVLVDSGPPLGRRALLAAVDRLAPRGAIVTHWHEDHSGSAAELAARGLPLLMHPACEAALRDPRPLHLYRRVVWGTPRPLVAPLAAFDPSPLQLIATPGHTIDHQAVWDPERRVLVSGDLFLGVKVRVAHASEWPRTLVATLRAVAALEPRLLLDAHRGPLPNPVPLLRAKIDWMESTLDRIDSLHARGLDAHEITRRVLGRETLVGVISRGEYSKRALVNAVLQR
jgi:glyoxylase-like metal-dependent hydrolase (beta-lactamase superfamily II)